MTDYLAFAKYMHKYLKCQSLLMAGMLLMGVGHTEAAVIHARSASYVDVAAAVTLAANGDTVAVPAGTATWNTTLIINKAITLQGAGIGQTVILDGLTKD